MNECIVLDSLVELQDFPNHHDGISFNPAAILHIESTGPKSYIPLLEKVLPLVQFLVSIILLGGVCLPRLVSGIRRVKRNRIRIPLGT